MDNSKESKKGRPVLSPPRSPVEHALDIAGLMGVLSGWYLAWHFHSRLPDKIPCHINFQGIVDGWGSKDMLWYLPVLATFFFVLLRILEQFPHTFNYPFRITQENAEIQYMLARNFVNWQKTIAVGLLIYLEWKMVDLALKTENRTDLWFFWILISAMAISSGIYFYKAYKLK